MFPGWLLAALVCHSIPQSTAIPAHVQGEGALLALVLASVNIAVQCQKLGTHRVSESTFCGLCEEQGDETFFMRTLEVSARPSEPLQSISFVCDQEEMVTVAVQTRPVRQPETEPLVMFVDLRPELTFSEPDDDGKVTLPTSVGAGEHLITVEGNNILHVHLSSKFCNVVEESATAVDADVEQEETEHQVVDRPGMILEESPSSLKVTADDDENRLNGFQAEIHLGSIGEASDASDHKTTHDHDVWTKLVANGRLMMEEEEEGNITENPATMEALQTGTAGSSTELAETGSYVVVSARRITHAITTVVAVAWNGGGLLKAIFSLAFLVPFFALWLSVVTLLCWCTDRNEGGDKHVQSETVSTIGGSMTPASETVLSEKRVLAGPTPASARSLKSPNKPTSDAAPAGATGALYP
mmetsp:Transcript_36473/g.97080  ORF Transcript_36473/g.97080 Transcript_36473/m.97080 type:complete len:413 (-) Transcript_36473:374-1612(-)